MDILRRIALLISAARPMTAPARTLAAEGEHEYICRLKHRKEELHRITTKHACLWIWFIAAGLSAAAIGVLSYTSRVAAWWMLPFMAACSFALRSLTAAARSHARLRRIVRFYEDGVGRIQNVWQGAGIGGDKYLPPERPYAVDLNLFGSGSLFELLCSARTEAGRTMLAHWLLSASGNGRDPAAADCDFRTSGPHRACRAGIPKTAATFDLGAREVSSTYEP